MTTLREDFPQAAAVMAECVAQPTFPAKEFAKVQKLALAEIANRSADPQAEISELFADRLPAATPYHVVADGKTESVQSLTAEDLRRHYARCFTPERMVVAIFGNVDADAAAALAGKLFGGLRPACQPPAIDFHRPNALPHSAAYHKRTNKDIGAILLGYPCESIFDKKDHAAMTVLTAILSGYGYPGGWLHHELREAGLVYFVQAFELIGPAPGYFTVISQARPDKVGEVVSRIRGDIERAKLGKITAEEFHTAVRQIVSLHAQENTAIAGQARQAALDELYGLGWDYDKTLRPTHSGSDHGRRRPRGAKIPGQVAPCDLLAGSGMIASAPGGIGRASGERTKRANRFFFQFLTPAQRAGDNGLELNAFPAARAKATAPRPSAPPQRICFQPSLPKPLCERTTRMKRRDF